jgi:hypothetical protein
VSAISHTHVVLNVWGDALHAPQGRLSFLVHRFHSISFTRAQGIPRYKIGFGREKDGKVGERLVEGGGGHAARDGGWGEQPSLAVMLATGQFKNWGFSTPFLP